MLSCIYNTIPFIPQNPLNVPRWIEPGPSQWMLESTSCISIGPFHPPSMFHKVLLPYGGSNFVIEPVSITVFIYTQTVLNLKT